jgi:hypothetical protein
LHITTAIYGIANKAGLARENVLPHGGFSLLFFPPSLLPSSSRNSISRNQTLHHPEHLAHGKYPRAVLHLEKLAPFLPATSSSKPACVSIGRRNRWTSWTTQEHKPEHPLGRLILPNKTDKQTVNCTQTQTAEGVSRMLNLPQRKGTGQRTKFSVLNSQWANTGKVAKTVGWGDKPPPKAGHIVDHRADLSKRAAFETELPHRTEKQTENCNQT